MTSDQGPTGELGRPLSDLGRYSAAVYGVAYAVAVSINSYVLIAVLFAARLDLSFLPYALLSGYVPLALCNWFPSIGRLWQAKAGFGQGGPAPGLSMFAIGIVSGSLAGLVLPWVLLLPNNVLRWSILLIASLAGPLLGVWWILRRIPKAIGEDYGDQTSEIELPDLPATESFGRRLGELLFPNAVVALVGPLGAGKTQLSRAIAEGLGIANPAAVTSPTFTLIHEYPARLPIYHFDAYRLNGPNEFLDLGVTEYFEAGGVCLIEWADKVESALPAERLTIRIEVVDENRRRVKLISTGTRYEGLAASVG